MVDLQTISLIVQIIGVSATATAAIVGVRSYINSNKRAEEARRIEIENRQAQLFMGVAQSIWTKEYAEAEYRINTLVLKNMDDLRKIITDEYIAWGVFCNFYEALGILVRENLIDVDLVSKMVSGNIISFWETNGSVIKQARVEWNWPRFLLEIEYLYERIVAHGRAHPELGIASPNYATDPKLKNG
jgi:hypothetical protein